MLALVKPRLAAVYHFSNDFDTGIEIEREIRKHYDGPLALVQDLMVFNVTANDVCVRMAVTASHVWPNKERHEAGFRVALATSGPQDVALARRQTAVPEILDHPLPIDGLGGNHGEISAASVS